MDTFCKICPNDCNVNRKIQTGVCGVNDSLKIAKYYAHPFEEPPISGTKGSGTIFFTGCSLKCVFCQNFKLSRNETGKEITVKNLSDIFKELELSGVHNINLVNPTHYTEQIIQAFNIYKPKIPVVWNTHGYEKLETLKKADSYIDIYLPDIKFFSPVISKRYTGKENYFTIASKAIEFMANKKLSFDEKGLMKSGTLVRHLVLPQCTSDSKKILEWFSQIKDKAYINIMSQYTPFGEISNFPELQRKLTEREYNNVVDYAISLGITQAFWQKHQSSDTTYIPSWDY